MSDESGPEVKVIDRRRFDTSGEARTDVDESAAREQKTPLERGGPAAPQQSSVATPEGTSRTAEQSVGAGVDMSSFIVSLATQTLVMLGEIPHPESGETMFSREAAQQTIDIIAMLEEKTKGNLSEDEKKLMTEVLASVRLAFVRKVREQGKKHG